MRSFISVLTLLSAQCLFMALSAQSLSNDQISADIYALRAANAELGAKITDLELDKSALTGKVETLQFLLSQSRDQINDMQGDDAEIGRVMGRLERRLARQTTQIRDLEATLASLTGKITALEDAARARQAASEPDPVLTEDIDASAGTISPDNATAGPTRLVMTATDPAIQADPPADPPLSDTPPAATPPADLSLSDTPSSAAAPIRISQPAPADSQAAAETRATLSEAVSSAASELAPDATGQDIAAPEQADLPAAQTNPQEASSNPETSQAALPQGSLGTLPASALPGDAGSLFAEAKSRLLQFDYAGAETAFSAFLTQFGEDPQAGEAQYWLAEVLYQQQAYPESGQAYTLMIQTYPDDPRAPEALAKLARSMRLVGNLEQACAALDILPQRYPDASGVTRNLAAGERVRAGCDN